MATLMEKAQRAINEFTAYKEELKTLQVAIVGIEKDIKGARSSLRITVRKKSVEFPYPINTALTQMKARAGQVEQAMEAIEQKFEDAFGGGGV